ncbi:hypothetical protein BJV74DRAFT_36843 [Russula compacta]|nr:hypothetical protein BJV74DRAFT_36843 [Russula compacta]
MDVATTSTSLVAPSSFPSPSPSSTSPQQFLPGGTSPSVIIGFISFGAFLLGVASFCAWRRLLGHRDILPLPFLARFHRRPWQNRDGRQRWEPGQDREGGHVDGSRKPEMFNAWIQRRTKDVSKWEESLPLSAMLFATEAIETGCMTEALSRRAVSDSAEEDREKEQEQEQQQQHVRDGNDSSLQVAVLLQMPTPGRAGPHNDVSEELLRCPVRDELVIGLIGVPWAGEDILRLNGTTSYL